MIIFTRYWVLTFCTIAMLTSIVQADMVAEYGFEDDLTTSLVVANSATGGSWGDATASGLDLTSGATGIVTGAFDFDAAAFVDTGNKLSATGDFTLSGWVRIEPTSERSVLFGQYASGEEGAMVLFSSDESNGSYARFEISDSNGAPVLVLSGNTVIDDGEWHFLVVTRQGRRFLLYVDALLEDGDSLSDVSLYQGQNLYVGNISASSTISTDGIIDEVAIYDNALTIDEIDEINRDVRLGIVQHLNLSYATDHVKQKLDVFRPVNDPNAPLIVFIHGGGWFRGERAWTYQNAIYLVQHGYSVASLGYRLVVDYPDWSTKHSSEMWENMKFDLMSGLEYLVDNADTLGIDASRAIVTGSSAGGHLTLAVRGRAADWVQQGVVSKAPDIVAAVAHCPVCDLSKFSTSYSEALKTNVPPEDIDPMFMDPNRFEGSFVVIGEDDPLLPHSTGFVEHLWENEVDVNLAILPGVAHGYIYGLGLDESLSPTGEWVYPPSGPVPEHGQMGFDAAMVCIKEIPGYDLPYTPFYDPSPYYYYLQDPPSPEEPNVVKPQAPTCSWLFDGDANSQYGGDDGVIDDDGPDGGFASGAGSVPFNYNENEVIDLDGNSDFVHFGNPQSLQITDQMTVSLWLKRNRDSSNSSIQYILSKYDYQDAGGGTADNSNRSWMICESDATSSYGNEVFGVQISADGTNNNRKFYWNNSSVDAFDGNWHHVAFTFNNGVLTLYLDGKKLTGGNVGKYSVGTVEQLFNSTDVVSLGAVTDVDQSGQLQGDDRHTGGLFDEVAIWDSVLTDGEMLWLAQNSLKAFDIAIGDSNADGSVNLTDFNIMAQNWLNTVSVGGFTIGDFDSNGSIDMTDLGLMVSDWLDILE